MHRIIARTSGFTLIELIVGMMIFSIGMTGILALLHSTIDNSLYSRHEIVAANLLREEIELVKNIRNSNVRNFIPYDSVVYNGSSGTGFTGGTYVIENNFTYSGVRINQTSGQIEQMPISLSGIMLPSDLAGKYSVTKLYLDAQGRYTHNLTSTGTTYASYIVISPLKFQDGAGNTIEPKDANGKNQGYILDARVIVKAKSDYKEYDLKSVITDWKK